MPDDEVEPPAPPQGRLRHLATAQQMTEDTAQRLISVLEGSAPIRHIRASQVLSAVIGTLGFAFFLTGIEIVLQDTPYLDNGWGAMVLGLALLFVSGLLLQKLIKGD